MDCVTADIIRSVSVGVNSMFGVACKNSVEFYVSSSADAGGLFLLNFQKGHCERVGQQSQRIRCRIQTSD